MRIRKSPRIGIMTRVFEDKRKFFMAVTAYGFFGFDDPDLLIPEAEMWDFVKEEMGAAPLDPGMPKIQGEVLVVGKAMAPGGQLVRGLQVSLAHGPIRKVVNVHGDRHWLLQGRFIGRLTTSEPEPFRELPLSWTRAFGGEGHAANPVGVGHLKRKGDVHDHPLPNLEAPNQEMRAPDDTPPPACFAPIPPAWPQRAQRLGTYDDAWLVAHSPGLPPDFDWAYFNEAPADQRLSGFLKEGEAFTVTGMNAAKPILSARLPRLRARAFLSTDWEDAKAFGELPLQMETLWLFPHAERGIVAWRGVIEVREDEALDVAHLLLAYELAAQPPRRLGHYRRALRNRLSRGPGSAALMKNYSDIAPREEDLKGKAVDEELRQSKEALAARIKKRVGQIPAPSTMAPTAMFKSFDEAMAKSRALLGFAGKNPRQHLPEDFVMMSGRGFPMLNPKYSDRFKKDKPQGGLTNDAAIQTWIAHWDGVSDAKAAEAQRHLGETGRFAGIHLESAMSEVQRAPGEQVVQGQHALREHILSLAEDAPGLTPGTAGTLQRFKDDADSFVREAEKLERMENQIKVAEQQAADQVRQAALGGVVQDVKGMRNEAALQKEKVQAAFAQYTHVGAEDAIARAANQAAMIQKQAKDTAIAMLPWAAIQQLRAVPNMITRGQVELENAMARATYFDRQTLTGADLRGLDMEERRMVGMTLHQAEMQGGRFRNANLARGMITAGKLANADLAGINFRNGILKGGDAPKSVFGKADLTDARFLDADLTEVDFRGAKLTNTSFIRCRMRGARFDRTQMLQVSFTHCDLRGASFRAAKATRCLFSECDLRAARLGRLTGIKALFARCRGEQADFTGAKVESFRLLGGSVFTGASFTNAQLRMSGFVDAKLDHARFDGANLSQSVLMNASLKQSSVNGVKAPNAILRRADLGGAEITGSNFMQAQLGKVSLVGARLDRSCLFAAETLRVKTDKAQMGGNNLLRSRMGMGLL
jgi:uncharacterized protein YjbI with pentapeptide repeats